MAEDKIDLIAALKQAHARDEVKWEAFELAIKDLTRGQRFYMRGVYDAVTREEACEINGWQDEYKAGYQAGSGVRLL